MLAEHLEPVAGHNGGPPLDDPPAEIRFKEPRWRAALRDVAARHGITVDDLCGRSRERRYAWPRQEAYAVLRGFHERHGDAYSLPAIGRLMGNRDHTTVLHGVRAHYRRAFAAEVARLEAHGIEEADLLLPPLYQGYGFWAGGASASPPAQI